MRRNRSFLQSIFLRVHYKTSLAFVSVFLGVLAFSGFYFFGQNIVNEADEMQRVSREKMNQGEDIKLSEENSETQDISPTLSAVKEPTIGVGGSSTPTGVTVLPTQPSPSVTATPSATPSSAPQLDAANFLLGNPNAEKTILAYYDFECNYCKTFVEEILPILKEEYFDTGKAKLIFKNFPISTHPNSPIVHNAALCASRDGNFWQFHDKVFNNQEEWSDKSASQITTYMKTYYAEDFELSATFDTCVDQNAYRGQIEKDKSDGKNAGVTGTPTFIVGDEILVGLQPIETFRQLLNTSN